MNGKKKVLVIAIIMLFLGLAIFVGFRQNELKQNEANKKNKYLYAETLFGNVTSDFYFSSTSSNVQTTGTELTYNVNNDPLANNEIKVHFDVAIDDMTDVIPAGKLIFFLNSTHIFFNDGDFMDYVLDSDTQVTFQSGDDVFGYIKSTADMPYCELFDGTEVDVSSCGGDSDYYWYYDSYGIIIANGKDISGTTYSANLSITFALDSHYDDNQSYDGFYVSGSLQLDEEYFDYDSLVTTTVKGIEEISLSNVTSSQEEEYSEWQADWGTEGTAYDSYILYQVGGYVDYSSLFNLKFTLGDSNGTLVAYSNDANNFTTGNASSFASSEACDLTSNGDTDVYCYLVYGYNYDDPITATAALTLDAYVDGEKVKTASYSWNHNLEPATIIEPEYPTGTNKEYNHTNENLNDSGEGAVNKLLKGSSVDFRWLIETGYGAPNNDNIKAFNLWSLTNVGTTDYTFSLESIGQELDSSFSSVVSPYILTGNDYNIVSFYPQDDKEYNYENVNNAYKLVLASDYSTYTAKEVYVSISDGDYEKVGSYVNTGSAIVYTADDNRTQSNSNVSESNPVVLPSNVTKMMIKYTGKRAAVYVGFNVNTKIIGSTAVKNKLNSMTGDVVLKNNAMATADGSSTNKKVGTYLTGLEVESHSSTTSSVGERIDDGLTDVISYEDKFYEELSYSGDATEALELIEEQKNGKLYELLPTGAELNGNVTVKPISGTGSCTVTATPTPNYEGTNRTLVEVQIGTCDENLHDTGSSIQSGYKVNFSIKYTNIANQSYGTTLYKDVMYVASSALGGGYSSASSAPQNKFSSSSVATLFDSLVTGNNNLLFTTNSQEVETFSISIGTLEKTVKNDNETTYAATSSVVEGTPYSYKLQYAFTSTQERITNVVLMDKLEVDNGTNKSFKGYFVDVDTRYLNETLGVETTVYYSVADTMSEIFDITKWTTIKPDDVTTIKAIAVDCGAHEFKGNSGETPMVYINMIAPNEYEVNKAAYNSASINYKRPGDTDVRVLNSEVTQINIEQAKLTIDGTSNYGKGTSSSPALITGDLNYTITIKNTDTVNNYSDVSFEVVIPEGLKATNYSENNKKVTIDINELAANETKTYTIELDYDGIPTTDKTFTGSYRLTKLNNEDYVKGEGSIYNKVVLPNVEVHKYAKTSDTTDFSDEASLLVKKDEEFSYRVSVENTSQAKADNVVVVDEVPEGLTVVESSLGTGTYADGKVTWNISVNAGATTNLDYKVKLASDAVLGTTYRSSANVKLYNPLDSTALIKEEDTNTISILYQIATSVKVKATVSGALADKNKLFNYEITFDGDSNNAGAYTVIGPNNTNLTNLNLDADGQGSYTFKLKNGETITFKNLTGNIEYTISQALSDGYTTKVVAGGTTHDTSVYSGETTSDGTVTYEFNNTYSATGTTTLGAKVTYDKEIEPGKFKVSINDEELVTGDDGSVTSSTITYNNEIGQHTYVIKQINTGIKKISYDMTEYKAVVNVVNNGDGTLTSQVKYYDKDNKEVNEVVFKNTYLPNGLTIRNTNSSEFINPDIIFNYEITLTDGEGTYVVKDSKGNKLSDLEFVDNEATYTINLGSNEFILISDLPDGVNYTIKQKIVPYYETTSLDEFTKEEETVNISGVTVEGSKEIIFDNKYETKAVFTPKTNVTLEGKKIEKEEFTFKLRDVSSGSTNGYVNEASNDEKGNIVFDEITFTRPGTYKYEIVQLSNGSNNIVFDFTKIFLILNLTDNGDGTMEVLSAYEYENESDHITNKYSEKPVVVPDEPKKEDENKEQNNNPNTNDRVRNIVILFVAIIILFFVERWVRYRRYKMSM